MVWWWLIKGCAVAMPWTFFSIFPPLQGGECIVVSWTSAYNFYSMVFWYDNITAIWTFNMCVLFTADIEYFLLRKNEPCPAQKNIHLIRQLIIHIYSVILFINVIIIFLRCYFNLVFGILKSLLFPSVSFRRK